MYSKVLYQKDDCIEDRMTNKDKAALWAIAITFVLMLLYGLTQACEVGSPAWRTHDDSVRADLLRRLDSSVEQAGSDSWRYGVYDLVGDTVWTLKDSGIYCGFPFGLLVSDSLCVILIPHLDTIGYRLTAEEMRRLR